ncbi:substrate-binding domain-containing protein [Streptomyces rameus]|uniref:Substrate-binding domain-containing protein n=1 Tax=Streptomyces rameus TaxID=68261 RepID=A0ABP6MN89_9ACTN
MTDIRNKRRRGKAAGVLAAAALLLGATGCGNGTSPGSTAFEYRGYAPAKQALADMRGKVLSKGPHGENATPADDVALTAREIAKVKGAGATAAIVMHYTGDDWTSARIKGLRAEFARLGIRVIAVTDAGSDPGKQVSDLETIAARKPDVIVSIPTDEVATAGAYQAVARRGIHLVFMDNVPNGMQAARDYVAVVSADNYGNGVVAAHLMADALGGKGTVGAVYHQASFFVTAQRFQGFKDTIKRDYPKIRIVEQKGIVGPDLAGDAQAAANAMLLKHGDLDGIWGVWDVPTEGILAAARSTDRDNLAVTTEDLGKNVAIALAKKNIVRGLGAQRPYDQGVTEARLAAYSLIGKKAPPYVALGALPVTHDNLLDSWRRVFHEQPPAEVRESYRR